MSTGNIFRSGNLIHFGKTIGEVHVSFTNKSFQDRSHNLLISFVVMIAIVIVSLVLVTGLLVKNLLGVPLERLNKIVNRYAMGEYSLAADDMPYKEFASLHQVLIHMGERIKVQLQKLGEAEKKISKYFQYHRRWLSPG